jgi:ATP-dependent DNA helicase RecQ
MFLEASLFQWFGYTEFRAPQKEIITSLLEGHDVLALLPTGTGKSLCYQLPGLLLPGTTLVISPLIALMADQVSFLQKKNIAAIALTGKITKDQLRQLYADISSGTYTFVFIAPERLQSAQLQTCLQQTHISLVAIDESHCISQWGHDFRPDYQSIGLYLNKCQLTAPILALTATATPIVCQDIKNCLKIGDCRTFQTSFIRTNLTIRIYSCKNESAKLLRLILICKLYINKVGIIYVSTRHHAEYIARCLTALSWIFPEPVAYYHAGLSDEERARVQAEFVYGTTQLIVATTAFGMGINKANVRFVIHFSCPASLEQYYQEIGRAGRDGLLADTFLLWSEHDFVIHDQLLQKSSTYQHHIQLLEKMRQFLLTSSCRNKVIAEYFADQAPWHCSLCDICHNLALLDPDNFTAGFNQLDALRKKYADTKPIHKYAVLTDVMIWWLLITQPTQTHHYLALPGFGQGWITTWQHLLLDLHDILQAYEYDHSTTRY